MKWLLLAMYLTRVADLGTTEMVLARGGWEENSMMQSRTVRWAAGAVAPLAIYKLFGLGRSRKVQAVACAAMAAFWGYLAVENYRLAGRLDRRIRGHDVTTETPSRGFRVQFTVRW